MAYPTPEQTEPLGLETRRKIYALVEAHAGSHFREIQRKSGLSHGSAAYHLSFLRKRGLIREEKDGNNLRYFTTENAIEDEKLLMLLRQQSVRAILLHVFSHEGCTHRQISLAVHLSPSTTTWHLKKLLKSGIIKSRKKSKFKTYFLNVSQKHIMKLLITYKESFVDNLVDGLVALWDPA